VDARRSVATVIRESGMDPAEAFKAVTELLVEGIVEEWTQGALDGEVLAAKDRLPAAKGAINFEASSFFASKQQLTRTEEPAGATAAPGARRSPLPRR